MGFLFWNVSGSVFLGDVGSYLLGGVLMLVALGLWNQGAYWAVALSPLVPYVVDTSVTIMRRAVRGEPLTEAHRDHTYQQLVREGLSHLGSTSVVAAFVICTCAASLAREPWVVVGLWALASIGYLASPLVTMRLATSRGATS